MNIYLKNKKLKKLLKTYKYYTFLSPHFDDAILSCGALLCFLQRLQKKTTIITAFTQASKQPFSSQANEFLIACGYKSARRLFIDRSIEDVAVTKHVGSNHLHLHFTDATWRKTKLFYKSNWVSKLLLKLTPALAHVYPNANRQFSGKLAKSDLALLKRLVNKLDITLNKIPIKKEKSLLFAPLGIGGHADHVMVRKAAYSLKMPTILWEDFPYNTQADVVDRFLRRHAQFNQVFEIERKAGDRKNQAIRFYKSQLSLLFPSSIIPRIPERYYLRKG